MKEIHENVVCISILLRPIRLPQNVIPSDDSKMNLNYYNTQTLSFKNLVELKNLTPS